MVDLIIERTDELGGAVRAPPSKAYTHRTLIASSLSEGSSQIREPLICDDTLATIDACRLLGADIEHCEEYINVHGALKPATPEDVIYCRDSGSTIRFITPVTALADGISILTGGESLRRRPMMPLLEALRGLGVRCYSARFDGYPPIVVFGGGIRGGETWIRGDVSSQFISGLLFATPKAEENTTIKLTTELESKPYVAMTMDTLRRHGVEVEAEEGYRTIRVPSGQCYKPADHTIEGDYSSAAFILAAAAVTNSRVRVENLKVDTLQGDRLILNILKVMGVEVKVGSDYVEVLGVHGGLRGIEIDLRDNPDLIPVCVALASHASGRTLIKGVRRLRIKESDRVSSILEEFGRMGVNVSAGRDEIEVQGGIVHGAELNSHNDHRIAMACAITALKATGRSVIHGIECIRKSYPRFIEDLKSLGARFNVE